MLTQCKLAHGDKHKRQVSFIIYTRCNDLREVDAKSLDYRVANMQYQVREYIQIYTTALLIMNLKGS